MATTTNYGWTTPDDTALVKDGASAIRALGTAIDTSMNTALGTKKSGLVLLNTTSFSAVSSQAINSIFSSTYDNYQIVVNLDSTSAASHTYWRLRNNTTDNSDTQYRHGGNIRNWAGTADFVSSVETYGYFLGKRSTYQGFASTIYMYNPFKSIPTAWNFNSYYESGSNDANLVESGLHTVASSFNGINFIASAGNITGTISVYGFNK